MELEAEPLQQRSQAEPLSLPTFFMLELEFTNTEGETLAQSTLSSEQVVVVWKAKTKNWLPVSEILAAIISHLSEERKREVLNFARFLLS